MEPPARITRQHEDQVDYFVSFGLLIGAVAMIFV